jgi:hypothetical protein
VAVKALVALALLYVVGMNAFLSTPLFSKAINGRSETIDIRYRSAWSVLPGRVHAKELAIRGRDSSVEWILRLDEAEFDMSFAALAKQRFEVSRVHGSGISFRLRQRLDAPPTAPERVADLPPIEGFGPFSVRPSGPPSPGLWSDADYHLWTAHLERIVADDVREVWIDHVRFEGSATIAGRFHFKPLRAMDVGPAHIEVRGGAVHQGAATLADGLGGSRADVTIAPLDPRMIDASGLLHHLSVRLDARGTCPDIAALPIAPLQGTRLEGSLDVRRLAMEAKNGVLTGDGHLEAEAPHAVLIDGEHRVSGGLAVTGDVARAEVGDRLAFRMVLSDLAVARAKGTSQADGVFLRADRAVVSGDSRALDLAQPLGDLHAVVELPEGLLPHARDLTAYIPKATPVAILGGRARAEGRLEVWLADKRATGRGSLRAQDLDVRLAKIRVRGATSAQASFAAWRWESHRLEDARLAFDVADGSIADERAPNAARVRVRALHLDAHGMNADLDDPLRAFDVAIHIPEGKIVDRQLLRAYLPKGSAMPIALGRFSLTCHAAIDDYLARGTLEVRSKRLRLTYADLDLAADVRASARVHAWRWERGDLALDDAVVDVSDISVARHDRPPTPLAPVSIGRIALRARSAAFDLADPLARVTLDASIVGGKVDDAAILNAFLPAGAIFAIQADAGTFSGELHGDVVKHVARATVAVRAENMGVGGRSVRLQGDTEVTAAVEGWDFTNHTMTVLDSRARITRAKGRLAPRGPWEFGADRVELSGSAPRFDLVHPTLLGIDGRFVVANAALPDARSLQTLLPADGIVTIESGSALVSADAELSASKGTAKGVVTVELLHSGVRFHQVHLVGDFRAIARVRGIDAERGLVDLSGSTLQMRNVDVTGASTNASRWRGDVVTHDTTLYLTPPTLDAALTLDAYDASPLLAVALGKDLPMIFAQMTRMPHLHASARLTVLAHRLALRGVDARGGDLALRGSYVVRGDHRRGAFVVDKGILSVGLRLSDVAGVDLRFFALDDWLRDETELVRELWDGR